MKYLISENCFGFRVSVVEGTERSREEFCTLAENMFPVRNVVDHYHYHSLYFDNKKDFFRVLKWRQFFNLWSPNKPKKFIQLARQSIKRYKHVCENNIFKNERGSREIEDIFSS